MRPLAWILIASAVCGCIGGHRYPDGSGLEGQLEREVVALQQKIRQMKQEIDNCDQKGMDDGLYAQLNQVMNRRSTTLERKGAAIVITFEVQDLFSDDGLTIRDEMSMNLDFLATGLNSHAGYTIRIEGHTDDASIPYPLRRNYPDSWALSMVRSIRLMDALVQQYNVDEARFSLTARGEFSPVADNDTEFGRTKNNRVVVYLYPPGVDP